MKKFIIIALCIIVAVCAFFPARYIWYRYLLLWSIEDNADFDVETNEQIRNLIYQFYIARYTRRDVDRSIFTERYQQQQRRDGYASHIFSYMFEHDSIIFLLSTDRHYMQGLIGSNDSRRLRLSLRFNDMPSGFWDTRFLTRHIHMFSFEKDYNGIWRIYHFGLDH